MGCPTTGKESMALMNSECYRAHASFILAQYICKMRRLEDNDEIIRLRNISGRSKTIIIIWKNYLRLKSLCKSLKNTPWGSFPYLQESLLVVTKQLESSSLEAWACRGYRSTGHSEEGGIFLPLWMDKLHQAVLRLFPTRPRELIR